MADKRFSIVFDAKMEISSIKSALDEINKLTSNASVNLPKGISSGLTKTISGIRSELLKLEGLQGVEPNAKNASAITKSYESIFTKFQSLQALMKDLGNDIKIDPNKLFPTETLNNIKQATAALDEYHKKLKEGPQDAAYKKNVEDLNKERRKSQTAENRQANAEIELGKANKAVETFEAEVKAHREAVNALKEKTAAAKEYLKECEEIEKKEKGLADLQAKKDRQKNLADKQAIREQNQKSGNVRQGTSTDRYKSDQKELEALTQEISALETYAQKEREAADAAQQRADKAKEAQAVVNQAEQAQTKLNESQAKLNAAKDRQGELTADVKAYGEAAAATAKEVEKLAEAKKKAEQTHEETALKEAVKALEPLQQQGLIPKDDITTIEQLKTAISGLSTNAITKIEQAFADAGINAKSLGIDLEKIKGKASVFKEVSASAQAAADDMSMLQSRLKYFFSSLNMINLFKRTVRETINTVKELDSVMTETAVVTDFTVGDMWDKLPQYASQASSLGASIKDLYAATTLYYQQGLQTDAAMGVGVETMKMARIAGMEASDATTAMTAALRGFNMEVNELNAQRVNDVYSELAAITAADTSQIATAMKKTASIASSANMEFETTAALLAQIIETTQEAPETAGTAMKTIIARFTEVKQLFSKGMLTGEDEEGEAININKIDAALKTVGISLKDFLTGSKGIDDIFLELASKWDTLDLATQRYIATTAAGSRQQSRFIAMMSNYERTMELVGAAQNSTGASQQQFDKTLESMEAKLQRLKNAWDEFAMGLTNNEFLKAGVDALTGLLNAINKLTSAFSGEGGVTKSLLSLLTIVGVIKGGKSLLTGMGLLGGGSGISLGYGQGFKMSIAGKGSAVDQVVGTNAQQRAQQLGRQHGLIYVRSFKQGVGTGGGFGGFFGTKAGDDPKLRSQIINKHYAERRILDQKKWSKQISKEQWIAGKEKIKADFSNELNAFTPNFSHISMGAMAAGSAITLLSKAFKDAGPQGQAFGRVLEKIGTTMTGIGSIGMLLGPTLNDLGMTFSKSGVVLKNVIVGAEAVGDGIEAVGDVAKTTGKTLEAVGDGAEAVGDGAVVAGGAMTAGGKAAAASWAQVGAVLGWVALVAAVVAAVAVTAYLMHPETQLKQAKKAADNAEKGAQNAASAFQELNNSIDQLDEKKAKIDELTRGTKEWKQEVAALNDEVLKLVEKNPELASFVKNNNGILEFDKTGNTTDSFGRTYEDVMAIEEAQVNAAKAASYDAQRTVLKKQETVEYLDYVRDKAGQGINASRMHDRGIDGDFAKLTNSLARAISNGDLLNIKYSDTEADYLHNQEIFSDYIRNNFDYSEVQAGILAEELMKEASALQQFGNSLAQVDAQMSLYNDQLASTIVESAGVAEGTEQAQILENLDSSILAGIYDSVYDQARSDTLGDKTRKERREAYADLMGYEWAGGNKYNTEDGQITVRPEEMRAALASQEATSQAGEKAAELAKDIVSKSTSQQELIGALFNSDGSGMTRKVLSEWGAYNSITGQYELDLSKAVTQQGMSKEDWTNSIKDSQGNPAIWAKEYVNSFAESITEEEAMKKMQQAEVANQIAIESGYANIKEMADAFGTTVDGAVSMIVDSLESGGDAFVDARKNVVKKMAKHTGKNQDQYLDLATQLQVYEKVFGEEIVQTMSNVFSSLEMSNNDELVAQGFTAFQKVLDTGDRTAVEEVSGFIQEVNWNSSIEALDALNYELEHGTEATKEYVANLKALDASYFDLGSLTQDLVGSEQFKEISNEIDEILASNEELNASDVKDLAKSYGVLNKYLENTEITASGLAKALTMLQNGELAVHQLTDAVMGALSSMNSLDDLVADTVESLENFDYGVDENAVAEKTKEMAEILRANINKGAYGNNQNFEILDYMFGPGWDGGKTGEALEAEMERLTKILESNSENFSNAWKGLAEQGDVGSWLNIDYKDGEAFLTGFEGHTTDEIVSEMARAYGLTENMARMMLTDFKNYSSDIAVEIAKNDYAAGINAAIDSLSIGYSKFEPTKYIDRREIAAIAAAAGETEEQVLADLKARAAEQGFTITATEFYDKNGILKTGEELFTELDKISGYSGENSWKNKYATQYKALNMKTGEYYNGASLDFNSMQKDMQSHGFGDSEIAQVGNEMLSDLWNEGNAEATITLKGDNGELLEVIAEAGDTWEDIMSKRDYTQTSNQLTDSIVAAFEQIETLDIAVNEEGLASLQATLDALQTGITVDDHGTIQGLATEMQDFIDNYNNQTITLNAAINPASFTASATAGGSGTVTVSLSGVAAATGLVNAPHNMPVLTGEEGPELVQTEGGYYITGQNGPEMANIKKGDTIYTADETKKILKSSNPRMGARYSDGTPGRRISSYGNLLSGSSGKFSVSDDKKDIDVDKLYNILADIEEALRTREKLEREYLRILDHVVTSARDLVIASNNQIAHLEDEKARQEARKEARINQSNAYMEENSAYKKYAWVETRDDGERVVQIDWDAINNISDDKEKENVQEYLSNIENFEDDINEAEDAIFEIDESVKEIKNRGKDEMLDFENQVKDALVNERQKEIDKLSEINDSINDTNSRLLEAMSYSIEQQRQARENDKTEQEISDKQRQLAYLQQDTSGANALDIMKLQKEIDEAQEDYTDTLIDQKISELQKQNDDAATQRQQQIDIAQAQLDHYVESGQVWKDVYDLMNTGIDANGMIIDGSELMNKLKADQDYVSMSHLGKLAWAEELIDTVAQGLTWLQIGRQTEDIDGLKGKKITFTTKDGKSVTGIVGEDGKVTVADGTVYDKVYQNYDGSYKTEEEYKRFEPKKEDTQPSIPSIPTTTPTTTPNNNGGSGGRGDTGNTKTGPYYEKELRPDGYYETKYYMQNGKRVDSKTYLVSSSVAGTSGGKESAVASQQSNNKANVQEIARWTQKNGKYIETWVRYSDGSRKCIEKQLVFATGGLADFTGPAWLDGTKARPEYVLNADQTKAFFNMVNVLESLQHGPASKSSTENNGDINLDIDINVESIGSDYDVEQVADTIKRMIANDARYRNNNTVNLTR